MTKLCWLTRLSYVAECFACCLIQGGNPPPTAQVQSQAVALPLEHSRTRVDRANPKKRARDLSEDSKDAEGTSKEKADVDASDMNTTADDTHTETEAEAETQTEANATEAKPPTAKHARIHHASTDSEAAASGSLVVVDGMDQSGDERKAIVLKADTETDTDADADTEMKTDAQSTQSHEHPAHAHARSLVLLWSHLLGAEITDLTAGASLSALFDSDRCWRGSLLFPRQTAGMFPLKLNSLSFCCSIIRGWLLACLLGYS